MNDKPKNKREYFALVALAMAMYPKPTDNPPLELFQMLHESGGNFLSDGELDDEQTATMYRCQITLKMIIDKLESKL